MIAGCGAGHTYSDRHADTENRKSGAAHRTPFFCKSLSCAKHHAASQASCASFTQTSRMRWEGGRVAASVSALSLFPAACSTAVLCYHPPRAFFFDTTLPPTSPPCVCRRCVCCCCCCFCCFCFCLLLAAPLLSHSHSHSLFLLSRSPRLSCACLLGVSTLRCCSLLPPTLHYYYIHTPPPSLTYSPPPNAAAIALPTFVASRSQSLLPLPSIIEEVQTGLLFRPNREIKRERREIAERIRHSPLVLWYG